LVAGLLAAAWTLPAAAVNTDTYDIPYFGFGASYFVPDSVRFGTRARLPRHVRRAVRRESDKALEVRFFDYGYTRKSDNKKNFQTGLFADYTMDFGAFGDPDHFFSGIKPYALGGIAPSRKTPRRQDLHIGLDLGGGALVPIFFKGWSVRFEGACRASRTATRARSQRERPVVRPVQAARAPASSSITS